MSASAPIEIVPAATAIIACDGGGGSLGHPTVYLNPGENGAIACPYCSRLYTFKGDAKPSHP